MGSVRIRRKASRIDGCASFTGRISGGPGDTGQSSRIGPKGRARKGRYGCRSCQSAGAEQLAVPVKRHETSEVGTTLVSGFSSRNRRGRSVSEAPPLAGRLVESGTPHALTSVTAAAMRWVDAPETSLPKQAPANSSANLLRPADANRAGPTEISLTLRGCAVSAASMATTKPCMHTAR